MNKNELIKRRRRINAQEFAAKLLCHPDTINEESKSLRRNSRRPRS